MAKHPNKDIREAVEFALSHGWSFEKPGKSSHLWGKLYCARKDGRRCYAPVYSTPRNPRKHALDIRARVRRCSCQGS